MYNIGNYDKIIEIICSMNDINKDELFKILKDKELKYLFFLLLKKHNCDDAAKIRKDFSITSKRTINYNVRKGQEKFLINKEFRETYFEIEKNLKKSLNLK